MRRTSLSVSRPWWATRTCAATCCDEGRISEVHRVLVTGRGRNPAGVPPLALGSPCAPTRSGSPARRPGTRTRWPSLNDEVGHVAALVHWLHLTRPGDASLGAGNGQRGA